MGESRMAESRMTESRSMERARAGQLGSSMEQTHHTMLLAALLAATYCCRLYVKLGVEQVGHQGSGVLDLQLQAALQEDIASWDWCANL